MSDYLFAKIDTNRLSSVFEIYELYESLKNEDKVQGNYLYGKMCFFLNSYDEKLLIVDLNINKELYNYTFLRDFHESVKNFESDDAKSFMNFIRIYSGSIYKKLDIIREYMSEENKMNRYVDAREEFLGFTKISELPKMWKMFHIDLEKSCGSRFQKVIDCDLREKVSQRLLQVIDESDVLNGLMGLKNLKELFDILSEYIIPQDLMDLYLKITNPDFTKVNPEN